MEPTDRGVSRRSFLVGAGAAVASAALLGPNAIQRPDALARLARSGAPRLALGYVEGTAGMSVPAVRALLAAGGARVTPASHLRAGDREMVGGAATVHVAGLTAGAAAGEASQLDALVSPPKGAGDQPLPYYAWTRTAAGGASPPSAFLTAVGAGPSLGLAMRVGSPGRWRESVAVLTGGRERGLPKLRPGVYLAGLDPDAWDEPRGLPTGAALVDAPSLALVISPA